ncbi:MAG: hypothetical protein J0I77_02650 [Rudaea sp.]|uniref:hypothetical protein n=1 Tax=unclassified Rudaea TaxID=2627037 RepID=UPI0010F4688C|nr:MULTISPECIES: hypothetical protein [unclassified Rudaea]MBN8884598.1 hypothetical protein [Rudaea sp.]
MNSPWLTFGVALTVALAIYYFLGWLNLSSWVYGLLGASLFIASFFAIDYFHPWHAVSPWPRSINAFLVGLAGGEISRAFRGSSRNAPA